MANRVRLRSSHLEHALSNPHAAPSDPFAILYNAHHRWLLGWLRQKLGGDDHASDLAQDTFVRLLSAKDAKDKIQAIETPRTYLATVAQRVVIDYFRRRSLERAYQEALAQMPEPIAISPESRALILETLFQIDAMLDGLGHKCKQAFLLSQLDGLSYGEIAEQMSLSVSSIKKYMARATEHCLLLMFEAET